MKTKKYILSEEQKAKYKASKALKKANRSLEQIAEDKARLKIVRAKSLANRTIEQVEEQKAKKKIKYANRSDEKVAEAKVKAKIAAAKLEKIHGKRKRTFTPEQKAQKKISYDEWMANRSPAKVETDKAKAKINKAEWLANRSTEKVEEHKAKQKIYQAKCRANRSDEKIEKDKASHNITSAQWYKENTEASKAKSAKFKKDNPGYISPCAEPLGYFAVYLIQNYNGLGDTYVGQTGNLYNRMSLHRYHGRLNTDTHRVLGCFRTREQALAFEAIQHEQGYHGHNNGI